MRTYGLHIWVLSSLLLEGRSNVLLAGQHDPWLVRVLALEVRRNVGMVCREAPDQSREKAIGLKASAGELVDQVQGEIDHLLSLVLIDLLLGQVRLELFMQILGKRGHSRRREVERA